MSDGPPPTPASGVSRASARSRGATPRTPNYAARRMLVGTVVITALFAAGIVGWRIASGGDDTTELGDDPSWSWLALVDRIDGDVVYIGPDGTVAGESPANGRTGSVHGVGGALTLVSSQRIAVLPEPGSSDPPLVVELPRSAGVSIVPGGDVTYLAAGNPMGGNVLIIDPASRTLYDLGALVADTLATAASMQVDTVVTNADGSIVAVADATNFQTIVVRPASTEPVFLPDQPLAVGAELVATSQIVGTEADVSLVALDRSTKAAVPSEIPVGGVFDGDEFVMVSVVGSVVRISADGAARVGRVGVPTGAMVEWVRPTYGGDRLAIGGATFEALVDLDGDVLFTTTFDAPVEAVRPERGWACLPVGAAGGAAHSLVDLETGEQLADLSGAEIVGVGALGCAVLTMRNGIAEIVTSEGTAPLGAVTSARMGPDGRSVLRVTSAGRTELVLLADDLTVTDTFDLTAAVASVGGDPLVTFVESQG